MHFDFAIANNVLFADIGDHTIDIARIAIARQIFTVHNGVGWTERCRHDYHIEHTLSEAEYP